MGNACCFPPAAAGEKLQQDKEKGMKKTHTQQELQEKPKGKVNQVDVDSRRSQKEMDVETTDEIGQK